MTKPSKKESVQHTSLSSPIKYYPSGIPDLIPFIPSHWHNEFELNFIRSGTGIFYCNGKQFLPEEGQIYIFQPNQAHGMTPLENHKIIYDTLLFNSKAFGSQSERGNHTVISPLVSGESTLRLPIDRNCEGYEQIRQTVESIFEATQKNDAPSDLYAKSQLLQLFYYLHAYGHINYRKNTGSADEKRLQTVLTYIDQHFAEDLSVETLAKLIPLSNSYFMSFFKRITGISLITYINQIRVRNACEMLISTKKQVLQIAYECGFDNLSNFNRQFKKHAGCSPSKYRSIYGAKTREDEEE